MLRKIGSCKLPNCPSCGQDGLIEINGDEYGIYLDKVYKCVFCKDVFEDIKGILVNEEVVRFKDGTEITFITETTDSYSKTYIKDTGEVISKSWSNKNA